MGKERIIQRLKDLKEIVNTMENDGVGSEEDFLRQVISVYEDGIDNLIEDVL